MQKQRIEKDMWAKVLESIGGRLRRFFGRAYDEFVHRRDRQLKRLSIAHHIKGSTAHNRQQSDYVQHVRILLQDVTLDLLNVGNFALLRASEGGGNLNCGAKGMDFARLGVDTLHQLWKISDQKVRCVDLAPFKGSGTNQAPGNRECQYCDSQGSCRQPYAHARTDVLSNLSSI